MMKNSIFDPSQQQDDLPSKIVVGLERIAEVFRVLLWEKAKILGLSPIQIQILIFVAHHEEALCNVSYLAKEFNMTKPTISDAVRVLHQKKLIEKKKSTADKRAYFIHLSKTGQEMVRQTEQFANPVAELVAAMEPNQQLNLFTELSQLIRVLIRHNIVSVQRTCYACRHFSQKNGQPFCTFLQEELLIEDIRLDCPEFESKS